MSRGRRQKESMARLSVKMLRDLLGVHRTRNTIFQVCQTRISMGVTQTMGNPLQ